MPWYTTADARRDAEKQAARNKITDLGIGMSYTFEIGKSGAVKAIHELGAIEIVPHWTWHAMAFRQLIEERDQLRAQLAEYAEAPTLAMFCPITESAISSPELMAAYRSSLMPQIELIARKVKP